MEEEAREKKGDLEKRRNEAEERMEPKVVTAKCRCGVEWYSGWLASVGVDVARLRLDSPSRVAFSLLLSAG